MKLSSTSTIPDRRSRSGRTMARRSLCNQAHAVSSEPNPSTRCKPCAETPFFCEVTNHTAANHVEIGAVRTMKDRARGRRGLHPARGAHPQPRRRAPRVPPTTARAGEPVRPAQPPEILQTRPVVAEPVPKLLIGARVIDPTTRARSSCRSHPPRLLHSSRNAVHAFESSGSCCGSSSSQNHLICQANSGHCADEPRTARPRRSLNRATRQRDRPSRRVRPERRPSDASDASIPCAARDSRRGPANETHPLRRENLSHRAPTGERRSPIYPRGPTQTRIPPATRPRLAVHGSHITTGLWQSPTGPFRLSSRSRRGPS